MKKIKRLNFQLFLTIVALTVGSIIAFAIVLPTTSKYFIENKLLRDIYKSQENLLLGKEQNKEGHDVYHLLYSDFIKSIDLEKNEELLHQKLMYKDFFEEVKDKVEKENSTVSQYKYVQGDDVIYYVINKSYPKDILVSYKIDYSSQVISHQLFMNILVIAAVTMTIIFYIFYKWNKRLINNLKDIQNKLDYIGEGHLEKSIEVDDYTLEIEELMKSLETMRKKLYENEKVKQDMIHNISHDLKTPLAVIKNYAEGIIDGVYPYGSVEETAHVIYNQAERLEKKVQGLLYLNRLDYIKNQNEEYGKFAIGDLVKEVVEYMNDMDDSILMLVEVDDSTFVGDKEKWRVVIENLIDNSKRYAKSKIIVTAKDGELSVYNDGPHIEESIYGSIFNPFEVGKGGVTGLGLSIVKKTVKLYGYEVDFNNEEDFGVSFRVHGKE